MSDGDLTVVCSAGGCEINNLRYIRIYDNNYDNNYCLQCAKFLIAIKQILILDLDIEELFSKSDFIIGWISTCFIFYPSNNKNEMDLIIELQERKHEKICGPRGYCWCKAYKPKCTCIVDNVESCEDTYNDTTFDTIYKAHICSCIVNSKTCRYKIQINEHLCVCSLYGKESCRNTLEHNPNICMPKQSIKSAAKR